MLDELEKISSSSHQIMLKNFGAVIKIINEKLQSELEKEPKNKDTVEEDDDEQMEVEVDEENEEVTDEFHFVPKKKNIVHRAHPLELILQELNAWLRELPVVGFNSGKYDLNLVKRQLIATILDKQGIKYTIKKCNNFMSLKTSSLIFLDIMNYLAPGVSYSKLLKAYKCTQAKGFFPYEWVDCLDKLNATSLPPHEAFFSSLTNSNISEDEYLYCQTVWHDNDMKTFREYLVWYNNLDVVPFLEAVQKMSNFYSEKNIDMLKDGISVPGLTLRHLFNTLSHDTCFTLFGSQYSELHDTIKENIVGGPALIFNRHQEVGKTKIREDEYGEKASSCEKILGFDANALYLACLMQEMPTSWFVMRKAPDFKACTSHKYGRMAQEWLDFEGAKDGIEIRHQFNGKEKQIGVRRLRVDGWSKERNRVYQFHGCFWHGHDCKKNKDKPVNHVRGKPMRELFEKTKMDAQYIKRLGYDLKEMWECEWDMLKKAQGPVKTFVETHFKRKANPWTKMTQEEILNKIKNGSFFGLVECDIHVPPHLQNYFSEMQPVFKNVKVSKEDVGDHMREFAEKNGFLKQPRKMLIGSFSGEKILLATPLLKWYLEHGLVVTKVYMTIEYEPKACFQSFGDSVSSARREGDSDPEKSIVADTMKLLGNSGYGKTVTNKDKHRNVKFSDDDFKTSELVNDYCFRRLNPLSDKVYEIEMSKNRIKLDLPLHIGFFVYQYAKLRMLEFYYDFLDFYVERRHFQYIEMDTDSAYLALSKNNLEEAIRPSLKRHFYENWSRWLPAEACHLHTQNFIECKINGGDWIAADCCKAQKLFDKRTPGLFKIEWEGDGMVALNSKTYCCFGETSKISCKGINKKQNVLRREHYLEVLQDGKSKSGVNKGFMIKENKVYTYSQSRAGLTYFYPKRVVSADGVSTKPIKI